MKPILPAFVICLVFTGALCAQAPRIDPETAKTITAPNPVFPDDAKNYIYGDSVRVLLEVDKKGKVTTARAFGPLSPCSNLKDPIVSLINKTAHAAAIATSFEPILENGKAVVARLYITYRLRPLQQPLPEEDRKTIRGGVLNSKATAFPQPALPPAAKATRVSGSISVEILIGEDGRVMSAGAVSGHPLLHAAGVDAACNARFHPTTLKGEPAKVIGFVTYNFAL